MQVVLPSSRLGLFAWAVVDTKSGISYQRVWMILVPDLVPKRKEYRRGHEVLLEIGRFVCCPLTTLTSHMENQETTEAMSGRDARLILRLIRYRV